MTSSRFSAVMLGAIAGIAIGLLGMLILALVDGCYRELPPEPAIVEVSACTEGGPE